MHTMMRIGLCHIQFIGVICVIRVQFLSRLRIHSLRTGETPVPLGNPIVPAYRNVGRRKRRSAIIPSIPIPTSINALGSGMAATLVTVSTTSLPETPR